MTFTHTQGGRNKNKNHAATQRIYSSIGRPTLPPVVEHILNKYVIFIKCRGSESPWQNNSLLLIVDFLFFSIEVFFCLHKYHTRHHSAENEIRARNLKLLARMQSCILALLFNCRLTTQFCGFDDNYYDNLETRSKW